jgi:pheromone shutdown-related protein TraB
LLEDDEDDFDLEEILEDSDLLSRMMEDAKEVAPNAGYVLVDERDAFLSARIQQIRGKGKILAVVGAGHLSGIQKNLKKPAIECTSRLAELNEQPKKPSWPKYLMLAIPILLLAALANSAYEGDFATVWDSISIWLVLNAALTGIGVLIARGHPLSIIVGALASPITSLNPSLAAGWFAGYTQLKMVPPTGKDAADFLEFPSLFSMFFRNKVGRVIMVTTLGNAGSTVGTFLAAGLISNGLI